jgi:glutathione S-transferase
MKIYGVPLSVHTRKVQIALRAKGLAHDMSVVSPILPETLPPDWATLSPSGLIPVIVDDGFSLPDSAAILQYLDARYPEIPIIPQRPQDRGRALWFEAHLGAFFRAVVHPLFHQRVVAPMQGRATDGAVTHRALTEAAPGYLSYLNGQVSGDWLVGGSLSVADIAVAANLVLLHYLGERETVAQYPALDGYFRRLLATPVFVAQLDAEEPFARQMGLSQESLRH